MPEQNDGGDVKGSAVIGYRAAKNQSGAQKQKELYQLKINRKGSGCDSNPIQINLNIQNMMPNNRKHTEPPSERSLSKTRKE
jgi:hypothetical protein